MKERGGNRGASPLIFDNLKRWEALNIKKKSSGRKEGVSPRRRKENKRFVFCTKRTRERSVRTRKRPYMMKGTENNGLNLAQAGGKRGGRRKSGPSSPQILYEERGNLGKKKEKDAEGRGVTVLRKGGKRQSSVC